MVMNKTCLSIPNSYGALFIGPTCWWVGGQMLWFAVLGTRSPAFGKADATR